MRYDAVLLALSLCAILAYMYIGQRRRVGADRRALFDACLTSFDTADVRQNGIDYPVLRGRYRGFEVVIEPIVDHMTIRRLPQLWALVTLRAPVPCRAIVDVLARPQNTEFYSPWGRLPHHVESAPKWPAHALMRTDDPTGLPSQDVLGRRMRLFDDPKMKELLISPRGLRLVYQLQEADRGHYLVLRQATFQNARLDSPLAEQLLHTLTLTYEDLCAAG
jgi:hypothetical protein